MKYFLFLFFIIIAFVACKSTKNSENKNEVPKTSETTNSDSTLLIEMTKGVCFGRCPVYHLKVYNNGFTTYEGKRFSDKMGMHHKQLSQEELDALRQMINKINPDDYPEVFGNEIPDLPSTSLIFHESGSRKERKITWKQNKDQQLEALTTQLEAYAKSQNWTASSLPSASDNALIENEIIIQFKDNINAEEWVKKFQRQDMIVKKRIAPNLSMYVIQFDNNKATSADMLRWIKEDKAVLNAEMNKKTTIRE